MRAFFEVHVRKATHAEQNCLAGLAMKKSGGTITHPPYMKVMVTIADSSFEFPWLKCFHVTLFEGCDLLAMYLIGSFNGITFLLTKRVVALTGLCLAVCTSDSTMYPVVSQIFFYKYPNLLSWHSTFVTLPSPPADSNHFDPIPRESCV